MKEAASLLTQIYFHELESREKIFTRLQLNFAVYVTTITIISYMLRKLDHDSNFLVLILFYSLVFAGLVLMSVSIYFTIKSLTGFEYRLFPCAKQVIDYYAELKEYAKSTKQYNETYQVANGADVNPEAEVNSFSIEVAAECIDFNSKINEVRRQGVRKSLWYMVWAAAPIAVSSLLFVVLDLDTSSPRKNMLIEDKNLSLQVEKLNGFVNAVISRQQVHEEKSRMADNVKNDQNANKPNTPPPPPPQRPVKPTWQISTENFKAPMEDKAKILNEGK